MATTNMFNLLVTAAAVLVSAWSGVLSGPLCLTGDFNSQLRQILHELQLISVQNPQEIISRVRADVETTLNRRWPGCRAILIGSLNTGLLAPHSDVDFYIQIPNYNTTNGPHVLRESYKLFKNQPQLYTHTTYNDNGNYSFIQLTHVPTQRKVDLVFELGEMLAADSNLIKYFLKIDERSLPLGQFLKYWFQTRQIRGRPEAYALYLLIIFYLQQKNMAPPVFMLQKYSKCHFVNDWDVSFKELPYNSTNTENLHQLLGGFFKYYSEFNYEEYVIAPFAGRPIKKLAFRNIEHFPIEYSLHKSQLKIIQEFDVSATVCVQDPFIHSSNAMKGVEGYKQFMTFKYFMKSIAEMFDYLPSESILRALLAMDESRDKIICQNHGSVGGHCGHCVNIY